MKTLLLAAISATAMVAQQDPYEDGAKVFKLTCAQGYCHGSGGTQGRAPKLIGQNYEAAAVRKIVESGGHDELLARGGVYARLYRLHRSHERAQGLAPTAVSATPAG